MVDGMEFDDAAGSFSGAWSSGLLRAVYRVLSKPRPVKIIHLAHRVDQHYDDGAAFNCNDRRTAVVL